MMPIDDGSYTGDPRLATPMTDPGPCIDLTSPADDLVERCRELLEWSATGLLAGGKGGAVRALADQLREKIGENYALSVAESQTKDEAMRAVIALRAQLAAAEAKSMELHEAAPNCLFYQEQAEYWKGIAKDAETKLASARKAATEVEEMLVNLAESIKKHGNYSSETTLTLLDNILQGQREALRSLSQTTGGE